VFLRVNGEEPGNTIRIQPGKQGPLRVQADVMSAGLLDRLEIIFKGRVVKTIAEPDSKGRLVADFALNTDESGWLAARSFERPAATIRFAHTSPVFIQVGDKSPVVADDAQYFIRWIDREMDFYRKETRFKTPEHQAAMLSFFEEARRVYAGLIQKHAAASGK
jgi:hypothetical protein